MRECERMVGKKYRLGLFYIPVGTYHFNLSFSIKIAERLLLVGLCFNIKMKYNKLLIIFKKKYIFFLTNNYLVDKSFTIHCLFTKPFSVFSALLIVFSEQFIESAASKIEKYSP